MNYRKRVYEAYASQKMQIGAGPDLLAMDRWSVATTKWLTGWFPLRRDTAIADLGCGPGNMLHLFRKAGFKNVIGVDVSPEQVTIARSCGFPVVRDDIIAFLRNRKSEFDILTAFDVVEHLTKDELFEFLDACREALKPGGSIIIQTPNAESPFGMRVRYGDITHETAFDAESLRHVLQVTGFDSFEARECAPVPMGLFSAARAILWRVIRQSVRFYNLVETGDAGSGVFTRVLLARAVRRS